MTTAALCEIDSLPLMSLIAQAAAARLAVSANGGLLPGEKVADLFCGAGGWGEGARDHGIRVDFAVNHSPVAIAAHKANNPRCVHHQGDAWKARPREVIGAGTKLGLLLASAACTTHSRAKGSAPVSKRVHMLGWCIARWMREVSPRVVLIENVPEWQDWGPLVDKLDAQGRPVLDKGGRVVQVQCPRRKGSHFRRWWRQCERLGYAMEMRTLDAKDFGAASTRKRLFIVARRDGAPICWPEKTHGRSMDKDRVGNRHGQGPHAQPVGNGSAPLPAVQYATAGAVGDDAHFKARGCDNQEGDFDGRSGGGLRPYRTAASCIDWTDLGRTIFDRKKPLAGKTLERIAAGIDRYVIRDPSPFVLRVTQTGGDGVGGSIRPVGEPLPTQTTRQDFAVVTPITCGLAHGSGGTWGKSRYWRADQPLGVVHAGGTNFAAVAPVMAYLNHGGKQIGRVDEPLRTVVAGGLHALSAAPFFVGAGGSGYAAKPTRADRPMNTVKCDDRRGIAAAFMMQFYGNGGQWSSLRDPLGAVVTRDRHSLVAVTMEEMDSVVDAMLRRARQVTEFLIKHLGHGSVPVNADGLVELVIDGCSRIMADIPMRMLRPTELADTMGFRPTYRWVGAGRKRLSNRDTVKLIGNAVSPPMASALVGSVLPGGRKRRAVA